MKSLIYETQLLEYITILYDSFHHSRSFKILTKQTQIFNNFLQDYHMQQRRGKIRKSKWKTVCPQDRKRSESGMKIISISSFPRVVNSTSRKKMRSFEMEQHTSKIETVQMITLHAINPRGYRELQLIDSQFEEEEEKD